MNQKVAELKNLIGKHATYLVENDNYFSFEVAKVDGIEAKRLSYSHSLYDGILRSSTHIIESLLQDEVDLYSIKRYYLKPLLEDFVNLYNIDKFGEDYIRAMQVHFMSEDFDIDNKYRLDYANLGVSFAKDKEKSIERTLKGINKHSDKLPAQLYDQLQINGNKMLLNISNRIYLANIRRTDNVSIKALYDYANVHHHYDLRFKWLMEENDDVFTDLLLKKLDKYIKESSRIIYKLFNVNK